MNALDAVSPELVLVSPQLGRPGDEDGADALADSILAGEALSEPDLARLLATQMELPFLDLEQSTIDPVAAGLLSEDDARMYSALPVAFAEGRILLAVARPTNEPAIRRIAEKLGREIDLAVASRSDLLRAIERAHGHAAAPLLAHTPATLPTVETEVTLEPEPALTPQPHPVREPETRPERAPQPRPEARARRRAGRVPARRRRRRRLLVATAFLIAAPVTALAGNFTAQTLDDGPQPTLLRSSAAARPLPGAEEWTWPAGEPGGELPLSRGFRRRLEQAARRADVDPALLRAAIRARRGGGSPNLTRIANRLSGPDPWLELLALEGRTGYADRALALARYYRAADRGLAPGVELPPNGSAQIASGLVDRRLVALVGYLADVFGTVRVTSLAEPPLELAAPLARAHATGRALAIDVDGDDDRGTRLSRAVRELLLLPRELQPTQLVSVLRFGRPAELHLAF